MGDIVIQEEIKKLIEEIDVSDSNYEKATNRYNSIANYIKNSDLDSDRPDIYLQGSFKLGTAIKPLTEDGAYDIDIVCNLTKLRRENQSQFSLKYDLGEVVKKYSKAQSMSNDPEESKRCWTLKYVDEYNFHIDILPSVPLNNKDDGYIAITDKTKSNYFDISYDWEKLVILKVMLNGLGIFQSILFIEKKLLKDFTLLLRRFQNIKLEHHYKGLFKF